ncbi:hypothetical protein [Haloferula sp.]|uniref:hypothetical protein n=1 Tax=Haloferula sp. TaxID=2497595 RepID=UPI00329C6F5F
MKPSGFLLSAVCLAALLAGCSEKKDAELKDGGAVAPRKRPANRSFDPTYSEPPKPINALEVRREEAAKAGTVSTNAATKGRESGVALEIAGMKPGIARNLAMTQLFSQWADRDIDAAMEFGLTLYDDRDMKRAFHQGVAPYLSEHRPERLLEIIGNGNFWDGQWVEERAALQRVSKTDFEAAAEFFANTGAGKQHEEEAYQYTARIAQEQSIEAALDYAGRLDELKGRPAATRSAVANWVGEDSLAASEYVRDTVDPSLRDHAILGLADTLWQTNPDDTIAWVGSIEDQELRADTYSRLAGSWQSVGATEAVDALLDSPGLLTSERTLIEEAIAPAVD